MRQKIAAPQGAGTAGVNCFAAAIFLLFKTWSRTTSGVVQSGGNILGAPVPRHQYFRVHNFTGLPAD
jgi:hypothetical protein